MKLRFLISCAMVVATTVALPLSPAAALEAADYPDPIIVTGTRDHYRTIATSTATRTDTDLKDVPQAVSVVSSEQIADQAMRSVADVLRYVPGVALSGGEGHRDQIVIRGNSSTADFFVDGIRDDVQYYRGLYNLDRVEVLKGPNAMIFGRGGGGGVVNRVTKRPERAGFARATASLDSEGAWYGEADLNTPIGTHLDGRLNAVYEEFDNFRDEYDGHRIGFNPTLAWQAGPATRLDLGFEYARDRRVVDRGIPSARPGTIDDPARPLDGHDRTFFGSPDDNFSAFTGRIVDLRLQHRFSDRLKLTSKAVYGDYDKTYQNAFAAGPVVVGGDGVARVAIEAYRDPTHRQNLFVQNDLVANLVTGPVRHVLLAGLDFGDQSSRNQRINGFFDSGVATSSSGRRTSVVLADQIIVPPITFRAGAGNRSIRASAEAVGVYVQDQARIGEHLEIVAGLRRDWFRLKLDNLLTGDEFGRRDALWSPRLGAVIKPVPALSLYASWSRSFLPQSGDQFSSLDATSAALKPERFTNHEIGLKWSILPRLDVTLAAYRLDRTNTRAVDPLTLQSVLTGEQRSKGVELTIQGKPIERLSLSGGLAFQKAEIRSATTAAPAGRKIALVPHFQVSLWGRYDLSTRLGAGLGVYHQSKSFASISNAVVLPAFTRVDAAGFFKLNRQLELAVNVENLLDKDYTALAFNDNNLSPASPRTVRATARLGF